MKLDTINRMGLCLWSNGMTNLEHTGLATVEQISEVKHHPNADRLDLVRIINYWAIVPRDSYKVGDLCVYIRPDSVLPSDREWAQSYLKYTSKGRVRAVRLRGEWSEGVVLDLLVAESQMTAEELSLGLGSCLNPTCDVTHLLGVTKRDTSVADAKIREFNKSAVGGLPYGIPKTDEPNWRNVRDLDKYMGQMVDVTLKIDGQSFTAYCVWDESISDWKTGICSRSLELKMGLDEDGNEYTSNWHKAESRYDVLNKLKQYCELYDVSLALRGEVFGPGIQSFSHNPHSKVDEVDVAFYSCFNIDTGRSANDFYNVHRYEDICDELDLPRVPVSAYIALSRELIEKYDSGIEALDGQPFEGVVIKGDGFSFKVLNKFYDSKKE
jgi:RNA ligase (TIGR02306 family)